MLLSFLLMTETLSLRSLKLRSGELPEGSGALGKSKS